MTKISIPNHHRYKGVLFFPSISLPDDDWTYKTLLYYDSIHVIAPESYDVKNQYNELTKKLMDKGVVKTINPFDYLGRIKAYEDALIQSIEHDVNFKLNAQSSFKLGKLVKIHRDKFHYQLFDHLERNGLAKEVTGSNWIEMEESIALFILTFLATVISRETNLEMATNDMKNIEFLDFESSMKNGSDKMQKNRIRMELLNGILPYTMDDNLDKILAFKDQNFKALVDFRKLINYEVKNIIDEDEGIEETIMDLVSRAKELESKLIDDKLEKIIFAGVCGIPVTLAPLLGEPNYLTLPALLFGLYQLYGSFNGIGNKDAIQYLAYVNQKFG
jgi:hypothetical protein